MAGTNLDLQDRLDLCGLTQRDAAAYLTARGHKASFGSVQAWTKGLYKVPPGVIDDLDLLHAVIWRTDAPADDKGVPLPEGCLVRRRQVRRVGRLQPPRSGAPSDLSGFERLLRDFPPEDPPDD